MCSAAHVRNKIHCKQSCIFCYYKSEQACFKWCKVRLLSLNYILITKIDFLVLLSNVRYQLCFPLCLSSQNLFISLQLPQTTHKNTTSAPEYLSCFSSSQPIEAARTPSSNWYHRPDFLEIEKKFVFLKSWQPGMTPQIEKISNTLKLEGLMR